MSDAAVRDPESSASSSSSAWLARRGGPLPWMDDALLVLRRAAFAQVARGWLADLPLAVVALLLYYLERVEGWHVPRLLFAVALVLAFWFRFAVLAGLAREWVQALRPGLPLTAALPTRAQLAISASVAALGLWCWAWPILALGRISVFAVLAVLPLFALRGAVAPSFLARAACAEQFGLATLTRAIEDTRGVRSAMLGLESIVCAGFLTLFANLYALGALLLLLANSVLGLDVGFLTVFLAPDNEFVPLLLLAATALLIEPLRAALSALAFAEARGRNEGADLHAAIDALDAVHASKPSLGARSTAALLVLFLSLCAIRAQPLQAQAVVPHPQPVAYEGDARDRAVQTRVQRILARGEFHDFEAASSDPWHIREFLERLFHWHAEPERLEPERPRFQLDIPPWTIVTTALLLLGCVVIYVRSAARAAPRPPSAAAPLAATKPLVQSTTTWLADANAFAQSEQYAEALRALYALTLMALDRAKLIRFEASRTNGHYLRAMPNGATREDFARFTDAFERKCYGRESTTRTDYESARSVAEQLCKLAEPDA